TACRRSTAASTRSGLPCVTTAARLTDCLVDPSVEVIRESGVFVVEEVEEELTVALRAGQARDYDAGDPAIPAERGLRSLRKHAAVDFRVPHDAPAYLRPPGLELRLDEDERTPTRSSEPERRRQRLPDRDEGDVADHEIGRVRELGQLARILALEHGDPRVAA